MSIQLVAPGYFVAVREQGRFIVHEPSNYDHRVDLLVRRIDMALVPKLRAPAEIVTESLSCERVPLQSVPAGNQTCSALATAGLGDASSAGSGRSELSGRGIQTRG